VMGADLPRGTSATVVAAAKRRGRPPIPKSEPWVARWTLWPQALAPNVVGRMTLGPAYSYSLLRAAQQLSAKLKPPLPINKIVVFYPRRFAKAVSLHLLRTRKRKGLGEFKGLSICASSRLCHVCMAFRIEDVENHRTPADAYHVDIQARGGKKNIEPVPLYAAEENFGQEIHE